MKLVEKYSHLNGYEWIDHHKPELWEEILEVIDSVDAITAPKKISKEGTMEGRELWAPAELNKLFKENFNNQGWQQPEKQNFRYIKDQKTLREIANLEIEDQKRILEERGITSERGSAQADFFKDRISIEVQFGKYAFVQYDLYVKFAPQYMNNIIDLGIEIVPMQAMQKNMSSGPTHYERNLHEIFRQGRVQPPIPFILIGVEP
jgi:hypothetical protein